MASRTLTMTPADVLKYQTDLVRTGKYIPLGRMQKISILPGDDWTPPPGDRYIAKFGRLIDLRDRFLPIAQSIDKSQILVTAPLVDANNRVALPDVPDPEWTPGAWTKEEYTGRELTLADAEKALSTAEQANNLREAAQWRSVAENIRNGYKVAVPYDRPLEKDSQRMLPQRLEDRTVKRLEGTNFYVFQPVQNVAFQPEIDKRLVSTAWLLRFGYNPADRTYPALLIDPHTGEMHFFGGQWDIEMSG